MMKKTILTAIVFIGVLLVAVGYSDSRYRTSIGHIAPDILIPAADSAYTLDRMRGDYVLLNFWSSTDAPSRRATNDYTAFLRHHPESDIKLVSINFDHSRALFNEFVRRDSLMSATQFFAAGDTARAIADTYGLDRGLGTVLINPQGKIIAHNPSWDYLEDI